MRWRRWARALDILLPAARLLRRFLLLLLGILLPALPRRFLPLRSSRSSLHILLIVLPHYSVARLIAVPLAVKRLLLLHRSGIPLS